jgi:two-component system, sensor histidine kinase and response regulator
MSLVLLADDEPAVLEVLTEVVEDLGHEVVRAHDGREALNIARQNHPNLVVTDHMMPRLSGVELCRAMKSDEVLRSVPIILLSAALPPEATEASAYLAKPFELEEFETLVKRTLDTSRGLSEQRMLRLPSASAAPPELVQWMAHEIRTPLAAARAHLQLLERKLSATPATPEGHHFLTVARQLDEMEHVIEAMTDASRLAQGQLILAPARVVLQEIAREVVNAWLEREPGYELKLEMPAENVAVLGDGPRLAQVLAILLSNAIRHGSPPRHARLEIHATETTVELRVRDFGPGLTRATEEKLQRLREMAGTRPLLDVSGPGFGLFIASELVRLHGGTLHGRSQPGSGATFTVALARSN